MQPLSREYFQSLDAAITTNQRFLWEQQVLDAEYRRRDHPAAMDIYGSAPAPSFKTAEQHADTTTPAQGTLEHFVALVLGIEAQQ